MVPTVIGRSPSIGSPHRSASNMMLPRSPDGGDRDAGQPINPYGTLMPMVYVPLPEVDATM